MRGCLSSQPSLGTTDQDPDLHHGVDSRFAELCGEPGGDLLGAGVKGQRDAAPAGALHAEVPGGRLALVCGNSLQQLIVDLVHLVRYHYTGRDTDSIGGRHNRSALDRHHGNQCHRSASDQRWPCWDGCRSMGFDFFEYETTVCFRF